MSVHIVSPYVMWVVLVQRSWLSLPVRPNFIYIVFIYIYLYLSLYIDIDMYLYNDISNGTPCLGTLTYVQSNTVDGDTRFANHPNTRRRNQLQHSRTQQDTSLCGHSGLGHRCFHTLYCARIHRNCASLIRLLFSGQPWPDLSVKTTKVSANSALCRWSGWHSQCL